MFLAGLHVAGTFNVIHACVVSSNENGLHIVGNSNVVLSNIIGLDLTGNTALGNKRDGIWCDVGSDNTTIARNIVSGNLGNGVTLASRNNVVLGNIIGLDMTGTVARGNSWIGIQSNIGGDNTTIAENTVSGNKLYGVVLFSRNNMVQGNIIGLDMAGKVALGNAQDGIWSNAGSDNTVIVNNTVSGNFWCGLSLTRARSNLVQGNIIGLDITGRVALGNGQGGIQCSTGSDNTTITNNTVSGNKLYGVLLSSRNNVVQGNIIGLDITGRVALGNGQDGIQCSTGSDNTTITSNMVSGNRLNGVLLGSRNNVVQGNIIGLDMTGRAALGNAQDGIQCTSISSNSTIVNNTICGNMRHGVFLSRARSNMVQGNIIGLDVQVSLGNAQNGVQCDSGSDNTTIIDNTVSGNRRNGVLVLGSSRIRVEANRLESNVMDAVQCGANSSLVAVINNTIGARFRPGSAGINISSEGTRALGNTFTNIFSTTESLVRSSVSGMPVLSVVNASRSMLEGSTKRRRRRKGKKRWERSREKCGVCLMGPNLALLHRHFYVAQRSRRLVGRDLCLSELCGFGLRSPDRHIAAQ